MRLVNSLRYGLVIVLDPYDVEYGKRISNDPHYQDPRIAGPVELNYQIKVFDELLGNINISIFKYEPHTIPVLMAGALFDDNEEYLNHLGTVFDSYIRLKTRQWDYSYLEEMTFYVAQEAWNAGFVYGMTDGLNEGYIQGYYYALVEDDDDWEDK